MAVITTCYNCGVTRPLGARANVGHTTACPDCGSTLYETSTIDADVDKERQRILATVTPVGGIGAQTADEIAERMVAYDRLRDACRDDLLAIPGMGSKNTRELLEALE